MKKIDVLYFLFFLKNMYVTKMNTSYLNMDNECFKVVVALLENDTIVIDMEEITSFVQYKGQYKYEDIEVMFRKQIHLNANQFYDLVVCGLMKTDNSITLACATGLSEGLRFTLDWTISSGFMNIPFTFVLDIAPLIQDDNVRLNKVIMGVNKKLNDNIEAFDTKLNDNKEVFDTKVNNLENDIHTKLNDNIDAFDTKITVLHNNIGDLASLVDASYIITSAGQDICNLRNRIHKIEKDNKDINDLFDIPYIKTSVGKDLTNLYEKIELLEHNTKKDNKSLCDSIEVVFNKQNELISGIVDKCNDTKVIIESVSNILNAEKNVEKKKEYIKNVDSILQDNENTKLEIISLSNILNNIEQKNHDCMIKIESILQENDYVNKLIASLLIKINSLTMENVSILNRLDNLEGHYAMENVL